MSPKILFTIYSQNWQLCHPAWTTFSHVFVFFFIHHNFQMNMCSYIYNFNFTLKSDRYGKFLLLVHTTPAQVGKFVPFLGSSSGCPATSLRKVSDFLEPIEPCWESNRTCQPDPGRAVVHGAPIPRVGKGLPGFGNWDHTRALLWWSWRAGPPGHTGGLNVRSKLVRQMDSWFEWNFSSFRCWASYTTLFHIHPRLFHSQTPFLKTIFARVILQNDLHWNLIVKCQISM